MTTLFSTLVLFNAIVLPINGWKPMFGLSFIKPGIADSKPALTTYHGNKFTLPATSIETSSLFETASFMPGLHHSSLSNDDLCTNYKVGFTQDLYFQYIQYKYDMPELKEFTLCLWSKFTNHSNDHPLFSYAVDGQPRAIFAWVTNTDRSSYFCMSVAGHTFFRLNYPLRLNRWYHSCYSWNGRSGEWQLWVNAERVGRGFHNRLVGHKIPGGGIAITGQEQRQLGGGFLEGHDAPHGSGGMLGEVTMLQLYKVALTAGKAHRNHKHHHAHTFLHEGVTTTTTPAPPSTSSPQPMHPLLTGGQINPMLKLNFAGGQPSEMPAQQPQLIPTTLNGQSYNTQLLNGQFFNRLVSEQLIKAGVNPSSDSNRLFLPATQATDHPLVNSGLVHPQLVNPANVQIIDTTDLVGHQLLFKRESEAKKHNGTHTLRKRVLPQRIPAIKKKSKRSAKEPTAEAEPKQHAKRGLLLLGDALYDDGNSDGVMLHLDGLASIGNNQPVLNEQKHTSEEREPAEAEVRAVMAVCSGCADEPFDKALVFGWKSVAKKLYSGAYYTPAALECKMF